MGYYQHPDVLGTVRPSRKHQQLVARIVSNCNYFAAVHDLDLEALLEPRAREADRNSLSPDIGFYLNASTDLRVVVELSENQRMARDFYHYKYHYYRIGFIEGFFDFEELFHWDLVQNRIDRYDFYLADEQLHVDSYPLISA